MSIHHAPVANAGVKTKLMKITVVGSSLAKPIKIGIKATKVVATKYNAHFPAIFPI